MPVEEGTSVSFRAADNSEFLVILIYLSPILAEASIKQVPQGLKYAISRHPVASAGTMLKLSKVRGQLLGSVSVLKLLAPWRGTRLLNVVKAYVGSRDWQ